MWAVRGILAALYQCQRTGKGRLVECALLETAIGFSSWTSAQWLADHEEPTRQGSRRRGLVQYASDAELGEVPQIRTPIKIGENVRVPTVDPRLSQQNAEIFGRLGVNETKLEELRARGRGMIPASNVSPERLPRPGRSDGGASLP